MSKEHAYAYEAGYRDGSINYELEHCPACKNVADLQEALAENAKLQASNEVIAEDHAVLCEQNAELRELVRDMWFWSYEGHIDSESQERQMSHIDAVIQRMRELGVEVPR